MTQSFPALIERVYRQLVRLASTLQSPLLLAIRLYWGWQFVVTGWGKLSDLHQTADNFAKFDIPVPFPYFSALSAGTTECVCGLLLLVGFASRLITIPLMATMCVAFYTADHARVVGIFKDPDAFVSGAPFLFLFASVIVFVFGPGLFSVDGVIARRRRLQASSPL